MEQHLSSAHKAEVYAELYGLELVEVYDLEDDMGVIAVFKAH